MELPGNVEHGTANAYGVHRCRCICCQQWRRTYDYLRYWKKQGGSANRRRRNGPVVRRPWYICAEDGERFQFHDYLAGQCLRCDAKQEEEELWEQKWREP